MTNEVTDRGINRTLDDLIKETVRQGRLCKEAWDRRDYTAATKHLKRARELSGIADRVQSALRPSSAV